jgi:hypothetical protein
MVGEWILSYVLGARDDNLSFMNYTTSNASWSLLCGLWSCFALKAFSQQQLHHPTPLSHVLSQNNANSFWNLRLDLGRQTTKYIACEPLNSS